MDICPGARLDNANLNFRVLPKGIYFSPSLFDSGLALDINYLSLENALSTVSYHCLPSLFLAGKEQLVM